MSPSSALPSRAAITIDRKVLRTSSPLLVFTVFVDTVGDLLVDLAQSDLHFVERFLARDIF